MKRIYKIMRDKKGEGYIDAAVVVFCVMFVIALGVRIFPVFITKIQLDNFADELVREARLAIRQLTQEIVQSICTAPEIEQKMEQLVGQLETVKGKKSYGYLPESVKKTVDEAVDKLEELLVVRECYDQWCILQNEVENYCHDKPRERKKLAQEKKFRQIKNAIIQEAENIRLGVMTFEDEKVEDRDEWVENWEVSYECLRLRAKIEDRKLPLDQRDEAVGDLE